MGLAIMEVATPLVLPVVNPRIPGGKEKVYGSIP